MSVKEEAEAVLPSAKDLLHKDPLPITDPPLLGITTTPPRIHNPNTNPNTNLNLNHGMNHTKDRGMMKDNSV